MSEENTANAGNKFAEYPVCRVCGKIMSHNAKNLKKIGNDQFLHMKCYNYIASRIMRQIIDDNITRLMAAPTAGPQNEE